MSIRLTDPRRVAPYLTDASNLPGGHAEGVVIPRSESDVRAYLHEAQAHRRPMTVAGHGSGLVGGRVPFGGWVLSTERLDRLELRRGDRRRWVAVAQPGVPLGRLQDAAAARSLFYPPDPTERDAFLGGTVSTNASGACSFRYGPTRRHVRALRVVLADGQTLAMRRGQCRARGGRLRLRTEQGRTIEVPLPTYRLPETKHVAGYFASPRLDAVDLFIGAEGTLGIVTEIELGLRPLPGAVASLIAFFTSEEASWRFAIRARRLSRQRRPPVRARALEYLDAQSLNLVRGEFPELPSAARAAILLEQETAASELPRLIGLWREEVASTGGLRDALWVATTPQGQQRMKAFRRAVPLAVNAQRRQAGQPKLSTDMAVPDARLLDLLRAYRRTLDRLGEPFCVFGHIGDNHLHANLMPRTPAELARAREAYAHLLARAVALGGTISAEHGIGKLKRAFLRLMFSRRDLAQMRALKAALDPLWILGQGNLFER